MGVQRYYVKQWDKGSVKVERLGTDWISKVGDGKWFKVTVGLNNSAMLQRSNSGVEQ